MLVGSRKHAYDFPFFYREIGTLPVHQQIAADRFVFKMRKSLQTEFFSSEIDICSEPLVHGEGLHLTRPFVNSPGTNKSERCCRVFLQQQRHYFGAGDQDITYIPPVNDLVIFEIAMPVRFGIKLNSKNIGMMILRPKNINVTGNRAVEFVNISEPVI